MPYALELIDIVKRFGAVTANRGVTIRIPTGAVTAIVGENGAGKSTAMNIAYGLYRPDAGSVRMADETVVFASPADAIARGVGMVHQHFKLVENFSVLENVVLGAEGGLFLHRGLARARRELLRLAEAYGLTVPLAARIGDLPVGVRQKVEILKALYRGARILILDEPTAVLTPEEAEALFAVVRALTAQGVAVALISHKLKEVLAVADRIVVMRAGAVAAERAAGETDEAELAELMVGRPIRLEAARRGTIGEVLLQADHLSLRDPSGRSSLDDVSLSVRSGEIVGVAGVSGNGQTALLDALAGLRSPTAGALVVKGTRFDRDRPADPVLLRALGLAYVPEDRSRFAMAGRLSAAETVMIGRQRKEPYTDRFGCLDVAAGYRACARLMADWDVRPPDPALTAVDFSGGNQQKLIVGREVAVGPQVLLIGQPTRGVDIGAVALIREKVVALRDRGAAVLLVSSDLDEILALSDRIVVMGGGRIVGEVAVDQADTRTLGLMMGQAWRAA